MKLSPEIHLAKGKRQIWRGGYRCDLDPLKKWYQVLDATFSK